MAVKQLSQITTAPANPALTDQLLGVGSGTTDYLYTLTQVAATISPTPPNTQTVNAYTLALTDLGSIVEMSNTGNNTVTVPNNATIAFPIGAQVDITELNTGRTTIANGVGVTILSGSGGFLVPGQYYTVTLYQRIINTWILNGASTS